jgi:antitoxin FitA
MLALRLHLSYSGSVAIIHIRDVPDQTLAILKARAARSGKSLQSYVLELLNTEARITDLDDALAEADAIAAGSGVTADDVLAAVEESRGRVA